MTFHAEKDLAMCGLACVLCKDESCPGCKARGCENDCSIYTCVSGRGLDGCYQCEDFPCGEGMLQGTRNRAFNRYAREYGKQALLERLQINAENGITYHTPDGTQGDYDTLMTEDEVLRLIRFGSHDPYIRGPVLESEHFTLRLVKPEDAADLLVCYSDPQAQEIFNADGCTSDFRYSTLHEMEECIQFFLLNYRSRGFFRFSILDKKTERAVGTVEMFNAAGSLTGVDARGILRLDLASAYERRPFISELLDACLPPFYGLFGVGYTITKAIPAATERITALRAAGFAPFDWPDARREHYWVHS